MNQPSNRGLYNCSAHVDFIVNEPLADLFTNEIDMRSRPEGPLTDLIEDFRRKFEMGCPEKIRVSCPIISIKI